MVRVSYPDLIGVDRGRDVLLDELPTALRHGLAFCRAVYHTSPMGDVVPGAGRPRQRACRTSSSAPTWPR